VGVVAGFQLKTHHGCFEHATTGTGSPPNHVGDEEVVPDICEHKKKEGRGGEGWE